MASASVDIDEKEVGRLRIAIDTVGYPRGRDMGLIIERLCNAFEQYSKRDAKERAIATLAIEQVYISSFIVDLIAVGKAIEAIYDAREALGGFMTHIAEAVAIMSNFGGGNDNGIRPATRSAIQSMGRVVAKGQARQVVLNVYGSNNTIVINNENAAAIAEPGPQPLRERYVRAEKEEYQLGNLLRAAWHDDATTRPSNDDESILSTKTGLPNVGFFGRSIASARPAALVDLVVPEPTSETGTALYVDGQWYVRLAEYKGALIPIIEPILGSVVSGASILTGITEYDSRGFPVGFRVTGVEP